MRAEKQLLLDEIKGHIEQSNALVVMEYEKLDPNVADEFRALMVKAGSRFSVVPKRMFLKTAQMLGASFDKKLLKGHIGVVYAGQDAVESTKAIYHFIKNQSLFRVLCGQFEGKIYSADDVKRISELPNKQQMRSEFLGVLEAPLSGIAATFEAQLTSVIYCIENKNKKDS